MARRCVVAAPPWLLASQISGLDQRVPPVVRQVSSQASSAAQMAPVAAKYEPKAKEMYVKYEPKAEQYAVSAWRKLNQLPLFPVP